MFQLNSCKSVFIISSKFGSINSTNNETSNQLGQLRSIILVGVRHSENRMYTHSSSFVIVYQRSKIKIFSYSLVSNHNLITEVE